MIRSLRSTLKSNPFRFGLRELAKTKLGSANVFETDTSKTQLNKFAEQSFIVNNTLVFQSVLLLPKSYLLWEAKTIQDITVDSLLPISLYYPTIELLLIGTGENMSSRLPPEFVKYFRSKGVVVEASATPYAASTFNVLNQEGRNVAAALLTLQPWESLK